MDTFPVGREFGSPDYDRLMAEDAECFNSDLLAWIKVANHSTNSEKIAHATQEFSGDIHNIQDALKSLGQEVSIETAASNGSTIRNHCVRDGCLERTQLTLLRRLYF